VLPSNSVPPQGDTEISFKEQEGIEDGANPEVVAARTVPFPSSIGLSFLLSDTVKTITATVHWGDYYPIVDENDRSEDEKDERVHLATSTHCKPHPNAYPSPTTPI
jgi:hypothetical protein